MYFELTNASLPLPCLHYTTVTTTSSPDQPNPLGRLHDPEPKLRYLAFQRGLSEELDPAQPRAIQEHTVQDIDEVTRGICCRTGATVAAERRPRNGWAKRYESCNCYATSERIPSNSSSTQHSLATPSLPLLLKPTDFVIRESSGGDDSNNSRAPLFSIVASLLRTSISIDMSIARDLRSQSCFPQTCDKVNHYNTCTLGLAEIISLVDITNKYVQSRFLTCSSTGALGGIPDTAQRPSIRYMTWIAIIRLVQRRQRRRISAARLVHKLSDVGLSTHGISLRGMSSLSRSLALGRPKYTTFSNWHGAVLGKGNATDDLSTALTCDADRKRNGDGRLEVESLREDVTEGSNTCVTAGTSYKKQIFILPCKIWTLCSLGKRVTKGLIAIKVVIKIAKLVEAECSRSRRRLMGDDVFHAEFDVVSDGEYGFRAL
ncbi:hypothetical protein ON010_g4941 [Phytophthora cinnamomi]|nr:hypothetical protein ON010_g4941 [Phytophthora cinnamomi]